MDSISGPLRPADRPRPTPRPTPRSPRIRVPRDDVGANKSRPRRYEGEDGERYATSGHEFVEAANGEKTVGDLLFFGLRILAPILDEFRVDVWNAGHVHDYCATYPICYDKATKSSALCDGAGPAFGDVFLNPAGTVHVTEGNNVPGVSGSNTLNNCTAPEHDWCRQHGTGGAYGRWRANATHLSFRAPSGLRLRDDAPSRRPLEGE